MDISWITSIATLSFFLPTSLISSFYPNHHWYRVKIQIWLLSHVQAPKFWMFFIVPGLLFILDKVFSSLNLWQGFLNICKNSDKSTTEENIARDWVCWSYFLHLYKLNFTIFNQYYWSLTTAQHRMPLFSAEHQCHDTWSLSQVISMRRSYMELDILETELLPSEVNSSSYNHLDTKVSHKQVINLIYI